jgi:16S rRNA (uracil1498-N3)-methyltransferase
MDFQDVIKLDFQSKFIAHCYDDFSKDRGISYTISNQLILIGPEGDFSKNEVQAAFDFGFKGLDLGNYRLRTETAAIVALSRFQ